MKRLLLACSAWALCSSPSYAQSGSLPPVYFNAGTDLCEYGDWKLVFQDNFNGNSLQAPWITFKSWSGMPGDDNPNWPGARTSPTEHQIFLYDNIYVSGGTAKLMLKRQTMSIDTEAGKPPITKFYTGSIIALPYTIANAAHGFHSGRFEARIKMPTTHKAHSTMWLWYGGQANEIDIAEAYGVGDYGSLFGDFPKCNYSTHSWPPPGIPGSSTNPYGLEHHEWGANHYPNYSWWDWVKGTILKIDEWHTYACEWDSTSVKFFLDGNQVNEIRKYYKPLVAFFH